MAVCGVLCVRRRARCWRIPTVTALSLWYTVSAIVGGGLAGLFLLAFLSERASQTGAYVGIGASLVFTAWATLGAFPLHNYMIGVIAHVIVIVVGYLASLVFPDPDTFKHEMTLWGWLRTRKQVPLTTRA